MRGNGEAQLSEEADLVTVLVKTVDAWVKIRSLNSGLMPTGILHLHNEVRDLTFIILLAT